MCVRGACYQGKGAWLDPRAGAVCLVFVGDVVTHGVGAYACDVFWKLLSGGGVTAAVTNNDVGDLSLLTM